MNTTEKTIQDLIVTRNACGSRIVNDAGYLSFDGCLDITSFCQDTAVYRMPKSHEDYLTDSAYLYDSGKLSVVNTK